MTNSTNMRQIILASQSPRRVAILKQMQIDCLVMPADIDEQADVNEAPADYVLHLAEQKALAIVEKLPNSFETQIGENGACSLADKNNALPLPELYIKILKFY